ncbi:MAG TPA: SPFH domain-containing protein [Kiritimatiellia bacterium]|nr:SPFH domain-containing protein [Kiritimatiellia bacterium]
MNHENIPSAPPAIPTRRYTPPAEPSRGLPIGLVLVLIAILAFPLWFWFFCRIEPGSNAMAVLIHKTGKDLPSGQILALQPDQKGIQLDVLPEGRYFKNPYSWGWKIMGITDIPAGKLGVRTRLYGKDLPPGSIIATDDSKGIVADVLRPGKYRINPYAYSVALFDAITIRPGNVGVITSLVGEDVLNNSTLNASNRNQFLVGKGMKGVLPEVLDPGTYYLNPYMVNVVEVNLQSQRFEMSGDDAISFLTLDGFTVIVEGTLEYALRRDKVALLTHKVGDMDDILKKIILPRARGFSRIEGSKNPAKNYIMGDTRQKFQDNLEAHLTEKCAEWGIAIKSVLIRNITPPDEIASVIRDREIAVQTARKYEQQIAQAISKAELTKQEMLAQQNKEKVEADTARIRAVILAQQDLAVQVTAAKREFEVAKLENEAATAQAQAIVVRAGADRDVIRMQNEADAAVLGSQVKAFNTGLNLARHVFYEKLGPKIASILSGDQPDGLGGLFLPYVPPRKEVAP